MAGGVSNKFQGSKIQFALSFPGTPAATITAVTKANPAVVTATAHGYAPGDVINVTGVVGMTELNNRRFVVGTVPSANTFQLYGVDSTAYGTYVSGGTATEGVFTDLCELTNYGRQGGSSPEIDTTTICSTAQEFLLGLPDYGTVTVDYNFAPSVTVQQQLEAAWVSQAVVFIKIVMPGATAFRIVQGFVQQTSEQGAVGDKWTASATIRLTGAPVDVAAA